MPRPRRSGALAEAEEAPTSWRRLPSLPPRRRPRRLDAGPAVSPADSPEAADNADGAPDIVIEAVSPQPGTRERPSSPPSITLPASTDEAVYDAIFASLKRHLLSPGDNV